MDVHEGARDDAGSAIGTTGSGDRHIVLLGHIDTVPGQIPVRIENGVLHGRGSVDAKGPLATFVCAAVNAARRNAEIRITVVGAVGDEHIGSVGARQVATWDAPAFCIIGEPSGWDALCLGYRGSITATYRVRQESRHTAGPGEASAEKVVAFWNAVAAEVDRRNEDRTGFNAITPAIRDMGTSHDGLADEAWMHIGLRLPPAVDVRDLLDVLARTAGEGELEIHGVQEGVRSSKQVPLVPPFLRAIRAAGGSPRFSVKLGTSDMTIVGPRPERPEFMALLSQEVPFWSQRLVAQPGITGWAQIRAPYSFDELGAEEKLSYDLWYLRHRSLALDTVICVKTVATLLTGAGAR